MNVRFILYIFTIISSILLPACNTHSQQVPPNNQTGGFGEVPLKDAAITLKYDTTSPQVQEIIGKLDKFYKE
jgi:outer membrane protein assembly factor BamE (lipoprotein component of BamABCDE complex)